MYRNGLVFEFYIRVWYLVWLECPMVRIDEGLNVKIATNNVRITIVNTFCLKSHELLFY